MTTSSGQQNTSQNSQTQPWQPAIPALQSILGNIQGLQGQSGINPTENAAIQQLTQNAGGINNFAPTVQGVAQNYLTGDPYNVLNPAYQSSRTNLGGIANPNNLNPFNTPGFGSALNTLNQDITNQINGEFAGAGRSGSGMNTQTLARGLSQGEGGLIQSQYNQNVANLLGANQQLFGNATGLNAAQGANTAGGVGLASSLPTLAAQGPGALLTAGQTPFNLLAANQGALAGLTVPIAGLGGQSQGQSQTNQSYTPSLLSDLTSVFGGGANSPATGASRAGLGILGMFA